jgi:hypothetical protein
MRLAAEVLDRHAGTKRGVALGAQQVVDVVGLSAVAALTCISIKRKKNAMRAP